MSYALSNSSTYRYNRLWKSALVKLVKNRVPKNDTLKLASIIYVPSISLDCYQVPLHARSPKIVLSCFCLPIYLFVLFVMSKYRNQLSSHFFSLCISSGVSDILFDVLFILNYFKFIGWLRDTFPPGYLSYLVTAVYELFIDLLKYCQAVGLVLIAMNRMTALVWPMSCDKIWEGKRLTIAILSQWLLPPIFYMPFIVWVLKENDYDAVTNTSKLHEFYHFALPVIISITLIILNGASFSSLYRRNKKTSIAVVKRIAKGERTSKQRQQRRLAIAGALLSIPFILYTMMKLFVKFPLYSYFRTSMYYCNYDVAQQIAFILMHFSESLVVNVNPFVLLLLSKSLRNRASDVVRGRSNISSTVKGVHGSRKAKTRDRNTVRKIRREP